MKKLLFSVVVATLVPLSSANAKPTAEKVLNRMDANGDGQVSRDEWLNPMPAFRGIDTDNDSILTYEELRSRFGGAPRAKKNRPPIKWVDVHTHPTGGRGAVQNFPAAVQAAVSIMDDNNIAHMVLMPTPQVTTHNPPFPLEKFIVEAKKYPDRFVVLGGGGSLNDMAHTHSHDGKPSAALKKKFADRADAIIAMGAVGFGELSILHLSLQPNHSLEDISADHPLWLMLADITAKHNVVIDMHFDPVVYDMNLPPWLPDNNPPFLKRNIDAFERFLSHNRNAKISWAHAGSDTLGHWTAEFSDEMLSKHPNLYMSLRMIEGRSGQNFPLTDDGIARDWLAVFKKFPDRFFLGGDQFFVPPGQAQGPPAVFSRMAKNTRRLSQTFLSHLPEDIAKAIGSENAKRVYQIK